MHWMFLKNCLLEERDKCAPTTWNCLLLYFWKHVNIQEDYHLNNSATSLCLSEPEDDTDSNHNESDKPSIGFFFLIWSVLLFVAGCSVRALLLLLWNQKDKMIMISVSTLRSLAKHNTDICFHGNDQNQVKMPFTLHC